MYCCTELIEEDTPLVSEVSHDSCCDEPYKPWQEAVLITLAVAVVTWLVENFY